MGPGGKGPSLFFLDLGHQPLPPRPPPRPPLARACTTHCPPHHCHPNLPRKRHHLPRGTNGENTSHENEENKKQKCKAQMGKQHHATPQQHNMTHATAEEPPMKWEEKTMGPTARLDGPNAPPRRVKAKEQEEKAKRMAWRPPLKTQRLLCNQPLASYLPLLCTLQLTFQTTCCLFVLAGIWVPTPTLPCPPPAHRQHTVSVCMYNVTKWLHWAWKRCPLDAWRSCLGSLFFPFHPLPFLCSLGDLFAVGVLLGYEVTS